MKRRHQWALTLLLLATGCSWVTDFVVVNRTSTEVLVRYTLVEQDSTLAGCNCPYGFRFEGPRLAPIADELPDWVPEWRDLRDNEFSWVAERGEITVRVPPDQMVSLTSLGNYTGSASDMQRFNVASLHVSGATSTVDVVGPVVRALFRKHTDQLYVIELEESPTQVSGGAS